MVKITPRLHRNFRLSGVGEKFLQEWKFFLLYCCTSCATSSSSHPASFFRFVSSSHKVIVSFFTGSQIQIQHNATFEIKMSGRFHWCLFGIFWHRTLSAIITSAPQAKFLGYFQSEIMKTWSKFRMFFRDYLIFGQYSRTRLIVTCAPQANVFNFRGIFFQKIEENDSFTVITTVTKTFCGDGDNFFTVKVTIMRTFSFSSIKKHVFFSPESVTCHRLSLYCTGNWVRYNYNLSPLANTGMVLYSCRSK